MGVQWAAAMRVPDFLRTLLEPVFCLVVVYFDTQSCLCTHAY